MKKLSLLFVLLLPVLAFSQTINNYEMVLVPVRFEFQSEDNQYRASTMLKAGLTEVGFKATYSNENAKVNFSDRCNLLSANLINHPNLLKTKMQFQLVDCNGKVLYETPIFESKEKDRQTATRACLDLILAALKEIKYQFEGEKALPSIEKPVEVQNTVSKTDSKIDLTKVLYAQPTENGFQLVDTTPQLVMKLFKTSQPDFYTAQFQNQTGMVFKRDNQWFFEFTQDGTLKTVPLTIKF